MKMSARDRIEAVRRCPEFKKEIEEYLTCEIEEKKICIGAPGKYREIGDNLIKKWGLYGLEIFYYSEEMVDKVKEMDKVKFENGVIELTKRKGKIGDLIYSLRTYERPAVDTVGDREWFRIRRELNATNEDSGLPFIALERSGLFLTLRIDLNRTNKDLKAEFGELVKEWKTHLKLKELGRAKSIEFDKWRIFDECGNGKNPLQIAKEIYVSKGGKGKKLNPMYNEDVKKIYEKVLRACNKAKKFIETIEKEVKAIEKETNPAS